MIQPRWTREEVELLSSGLSDYEVAKRIGRTVKAVNNKRRRERVEPVDVPPIETIRIPPVVGQPTITKNLRVSILADRLGVKLRG